MDTDDTNDAIVLLTSLRNCLTSPLSVLSTSKSTYVYIWDHNDDIQMISKSYYRTLNFYKRQTAASHTIHIYANNYSISSIVTLRENLLLSNLYCDIITLSSS